MTARPTYIDLSRRPADISAQLGLPSPRLQHFDGDVPPALSPLDAFAAQSRALAKQLDEGQRQGRRMSRLPPAMIKKSLSIPRSERPEFGRSVSGGSLTLAATAPDGELPGSSPEVEHPKFRPVSEYPRLSGVPLGAEDEDCEDDDFMTPHETNTAIHASHQTSHPTDYFGAPRSTSPEVTVAQDGGNKREPDSQEETDHVEPFPIIPMKKTSGDSFSQRLIGPTSFRGQQNIYPRPPRLQHESSDDDYTSSNGGSTFSDTRKLSASSGLSAPHSPISPFVTSHPRSPSINSEVSIGGTRLPRPAFNFSRPLSSASLQLRAESPRTSLDMPREGLRLADLEYPSAPYANDDARSVSSDGYVSGSGTYTHAKYSLPRGRMVSRNSLVFQGLSTPHFEWHEPLFQPTPPSTAKGGPGTMPQPTATQPEFTFGFEGSRPKTPDNPIEAKTAVSPAHSAHSVASTNGGRPSVERGDLRAIRGRPPVAYHEDGTSSRSDSTIRAQSFVTNTSASTYLSPDDHVTKAIECHERGSLKESTYHLRKAAMQNHPTGMLLYALACRHGWGMRANQREGVQWLRKAVDSAGLEVIEDGEEEHATNRRDFAERKTRRAQFALAIYELGVSHLNGWGIDQDRALALRCFEIAGNWGDPDALAEAGFCYAEGIGCKKDLMKAARFYRMAAAKGMSMVGNSWIYKDKYMDKDEKFPQLPASSGSPEKKRSKSRTRSRSIFGRKKV